MSLDAEATRRFRRSEPGVLIHQVPSLHECLDAPFPQREAIDSLQSRYGREDLLRRAIDADRGVGAGLVSGGRLRPNVVAQELRKYSDGGEVTITYHAALWVLEFLEEKKPTLVYTQHVAGLSTFLLFAAAQALGIPFVSTGSARVSNESVLVASPWGPMFDAQGQRLSVDAIVPSSSERELADARLQSFRQSPSKTADQVAVDSIFTRRAVAREVVRPALLLVSSMLRTPARARRGGITTATVHVKRALHQFPLSLLRVRGFHELQRVSVPSVQPHFLLPLHEDPEASTMVLAPQFTNQLALVEWVSRALPAGMTLLVKEHRKMLGRRPRGFYRRISRLPSVHLAPPSTDIFRALHASCGVITATGTAALDAARLGIPAFVLGPTEYEGASPLITRTSLERISHDLRHPPENPITDDSLIRYLVQVERASVGVLGPQQSSAEIAQRLMRIMTAAAPGVSRGVTDEMPR